MSEPLTLREWQRRQIRSLRWYREEEDRLQAEIRHVREAQHEALEQLGPIPKDPA